MENQSVQKKKKIHKFQVYMYFSNINVFLNYTKIESP